jgi:hypothetical protein
MSFVECLLNTKRDIIDVLFRCCRSLWHNVDVGVESFLLMRRVAIVNSMILEQFGDADRLMCTWMSEFDSIVIRHCEWRLACGARLSRSRIGGGSLLMSNDAMC